MTNLQGNICLITGATNGIGLITAREIANMGATVVLVGRNKEKTERVANELRQATANQNIDYLLGDLSLMADVRRVAEEFRAKYDRLDILINNAGALYNKREMTAEGYEMTFALNHMSYFLLTHLLLDMLKASAPARIVNVSSDAHRSFIKRLNFDNLQGEKRFTGFGIYCQSKFMNVLFTYELARRLEGTGVTANALHPGFVATGFSHNNGGILSGIMGMMQRFFAKTPEEGAETTIYLATSPEVANVTGKYFANCKPEDSSTGTYNREDQERFWQVSESIAGIQATV